MATLRPFQVILIGIFLALGIGGIVMFALFKGPGGKDNPYGNKVVIWGTLDDAPFIETLIALREVDKNASVISYVEKDPRTFEQELLNALAEGRGPDLVVYPQNTLLANQGKIMAVPYANFDLRTYSDTYIDGASIFLRPDGIAALPIAVDPMVMYWNKDIFATKGLARPPFTWEEMLSVAVPAIAEVTTDRTIVRPALAFGEYANVRNAKDILAMLFIQAGSNMVIARNQGYEVELNNSVEQGIPPALAGLRFYTEFSNPAKSVYTWNRSMPQDRDAFLAGDLAMYFGFASEYASLRSGNPNFNFDVADIPQGSEVRLKKGYGTFYGISLMRNSQNVAGAYKALFALTGPTQVATYARTLRVGGVYRASFNGIPQDPFLAVVARTALIARGWLDPNRNASDNVFRQMVEDVTSGRIELSSAIKDAEGRLQQLVGG